MLIWTNFSGHRSEPGKCVIMQPKPLANLKSTYVKWIRKLQAPFLRSPMVDGENRNPRGSLLVLPLFTIKFEPMVDNVIAQ